jgi:uncharacterized protein (TIGR02246 family)
MVRPMTATALSMVVFLVTSAGADGGTASMIESLEKGQANLDRLIDGGIGKKPAPVLDVSSPSVMLVHQETTLKALLALSLPHEAPLSNQELLAAQAAFYVELASVAAARKQLEVPDEQLHTELRALRDDMEKALNARDLEAMMKHLDDRVVFSTMNGDVVTGQQGVRDYFTKMLSGPGSRVKSVKAHFEATELSRLYGQTLATAYGTTDDHYELVDGMAFNMRAQWTTTLQRDADGNWKILTFHYSADVFDNAVRDLEVGMLKKVALGAAIGALLIGLFIGRMMTKKTA